MNSDEDQSLPTSTTDAAQRPWQFSIRGLMGLTFLSSILFSLMKWYGYEGFVFFVSTLAIALIIHGSVRRKIHFVISGGLLLLFLAIPDLAIIVGLGTLIFFGIAGIVFTLEQFEKMRGNSDHGEE